MVEFSRHKQVTTTGAEIMFFSPKNRLLLIAKPGGAQRALRMHLLTPEGLVDLNIELKAFQLNTLLPMLEELNHPPDGYEWRRLLVKASGRGYNPRAGDEKRD